MGGNSEGPGKKKHSKGKRGGRAPHPHVHPVELRRKAVQLCVEEGFPVAQVANGLHLGLSTLGKWIRTYRTQGEAGLEGKARPPRKSTANSAAYRSDPIVQSSLGQLAAKAIVEEGLPNAQPQLTEAGVVNRDSFKILQAHVLAKMMQKMVLGNASTEQAVADAMREAQDLVAR